MRPAVYATGTGFAAFRPIARPSTIPRQTVALWNFGLVPVLRSGSRAGQAPVVTVRDLTVPAPIRLAQAVASAGIVRDAAAFAALVLLGTMLSVMSGLEVPV